MKKIDRLLLSSFAGPFVVAFGIALFVLIMQFLWLYIDEIAGKGVSILTMVELLGYMSISTFPMALPIAVLIASVMVMGNLSERYELSSMKSAGVSLLRVIRSLILVAAGIAVFSYLCSDFIIPFSNLKFKARLYDIRKQKPALTLEKGVFNEDFRQFVIRISEKSTDGETIGGVMIEDQTNQGRVRFNQILADSGQMFTSEDKRFFVMNLFKGTQYQEPGNQGSQGKQKHPFVRTNFKSWTKVWDMREFDMVSTDEDRFKQNRTSLSMDQLRQNLDSLKNDIATAQRNTAADFGMDIKRILNQPPPSALTAAPKDPDPKVKPNKLLNERLNKLAKTQTLAPAPPASGGPKVPVQVLEKPLNQYSSILETFKAEDREKMQAVARNRAATARSSMDVRQNQIEGRRKEYSKTGYELYTKYSFALVCLIFVFIGAPMGAIIRKGGFGYPILVSIIFFVTFIMLTILCRKLAESYVLTPFWAAMVPCIVLLPIAGILTHKSMNDSPLLNTDGLERILYQLRTRFGKRA